MDPLTATVAVSPVTIGLIALMPPLLLAGLQGWMTSRKDKRDAERLIAAAQAAALLKKEEREEDYARQDLVAKRVSDAAAEVKTVAKQAADAALLLAKAQQDTIARTDEVARIAAEADKRVQEQLIALDEQGKKIHILVNSDMTAARTSERDSTRLQLLALRRVQAMSLKLNILSTPEEEKAIQTAEKRILELDQILADRHAAQLVVEEEAKKHAAEGKPTAN